MKGTREHDFTEGQDILNGPNQEKSNRPGQGVRPFGQRQYGARAEIDALVLFRTIEQEQDRA